MFSAYRREVANKRIFDPQSKAMRRWNRYFLLSSALGTALDPLFLSVFSINARLSCLYVQKGILIGLTTTRALVDCGYVTQVVVLLSERNNLNTPHLFCESLNPEEISFISTLSFERRKFLQVSLIEIPKLFYDRSGCSWEPLMFPKSPSCWVAESWCGMHEKLLQITLQLFQGLHLTFTLSFQYLRCVFLQ